MAVIRRPDIPATAMTPRPVVVEWLDSTHLSPGGWIDRDIAAEQGACSIVSVGWLIGEDDDAITLAQSITDADDVTGAFVIPVACVVQMLTLRRPKR